MARYDTIGVRELRRVARGPVVVLTADATVTREMWLAAEYVPEMGAADAETFPDLAHVARVLGGGREAVRADLASGAWDDRHGHLRGLDAFDAGFRLVVAEG